MEYGRSLYYLSGFAKNIFIHSTLPVDAQKFVIKPNFTFPIEGLISPAEDYFIYMGRLTEEKGILNLLEVFSKTDIRILIIGDGTLRQEVIDAAQKNSNINYLGFKSHDEIIPLVEKAEALIVPSLWFEGMPMTILEAFSVGTPVIGSDIGALSELIIPNKTGLLFNPQDVDNMLITLQQWKNYSPQENLTLDKQQKHSILVILLQRRIKRNYFIFTMRQFKLTLNDRQMSIIILDKLNIAPAIQEALETVYDPELKPANIVDLGLVYEIITKENGIAKIVMTLTAPGCPVAGQIMDEVQHKVAAVPGVTEALVELTFDPPWTKDMMSEEAKLELGFL
ncbi:glycosyltransferase [Sphingobacterium sp. KU25419]|nr:glycosyltransferase [Sphingobacterium sp. KU25419]